MAADGTHPTRADRVRLVAIADALGLSPVLYFFSADLDSSLKRNALRTGTAGVIHGINATARILTPPKGGEGFANVLFVAAREMGLFEFVARPDLVSSPSPNFSGQL